MKRNSPHQLPCLWLMLWPRLRSESRQQQLGTQRPAGFPEGTAAHATWVPRTEPGSYQQQFWEIGAIIISLCPRARSLSSERFSNLPRVTQPDLGGQVLPRIFWTPSLHFPPSAPSCLATFVLPQDPAFRGWPQPAFSTRAGESVAANTWTYAGPALFEGFHI